MMVKNTRLGVGRWVGTFALVTAVAVVGLGASGLAALGAVALAGTSPQRAGAGSDQAEILLQAARNKQVVEGKLDEAITLYREVVVKYPQNNAVAARALVALGQCYEKLGAAQTVEARKAYEQIVSRYSDQADAVTQARARLAVLAPAAASIPPSPPGSLRRIYEGGGRAAQETISLSADARHAVFHQFGGNEFVVRDLTTGKEGHVPHPSPDALAAEWRQTSSDPVSGGVANFKLSPDGTQIVYEVVLRAAVRSGEKQWQGQVRVVNTDGTGGRLVTKQEGARINLLRWAADGKSVLAWFQTPNSEAYEFVWVRMSDGSVTRMSAPIPIGAADLAGGYLSPDFRFQAIWEELDTGDAISVADTRTGKRSRIAQPVKTKVFRLVGWAPDGSGLVLITDQDGSPAVWFIRLVGGVPQGPPEVLRANIEDGNWLGIGPDGSYYYTKSTQVARRYVAALEPATGMAVGTPTLRPELQIACGFDWSPDGASIATGARLNQSGAGGTNVPCTLIAIRSLGGGSERVLSPGLSDVRRPRWSPDGRSLLVFGRKDATFGVFTVDVEANSAKLLVEAPQRQIAGEYILIGDWTPDGKGIYLGRRDPADANGVATSRLVHRDLATGAETDRYSIKAPGMIFNTTIAVSRDGNVAMLVTETDGSRAAVVVPAGAGPARTVYRVPASQAFGWVAWAADGKALYVPERVPAEASQNVKKLVRVPVDGGTPTDAGLSFPAMDGTDPSPDGKRLVFVANENVLEIWAIERLVPTKAATPAAPRK